MQKLISKYGLAAHLALLAVAPLVLFPYLEPTSIAEAILWLSLLTFCWFLSSPSKLEGESSHSARKRVFSSVLRDPLSWLTIILVIIALVRHFNGGVKLFYNASNHVWSLSEPTFPILPSSSGDTGYLILASFIAFAVVVIGVKHAIARAARGGFLITLAFSASFAAASAIYEYSLGNAVLVTAAECSYVKPDFVGTSFGVVLLMMTAALPIAFERKWNTAIVFSPFAIGLLLAATILFSPLYVSAAFVVGVLILSIYGVFWGILKLAKSGGFKLAVVCSVGFAFAALMTYAVGSTLLQEKIKSVSEQGVFSTEETAVRGELTSFALKTWNKGIWTGRGTGTLPFDLRLSHDVKWKVDGVIAEGEDFGIDREQRYAVSGVWHILAEQGVVGMMAIIVPLLFLGWFYVFKAVNAVKSLPIPAVLAGPLAVTSVLVGMFFNCSIVRMEMLPLLGAAMAVSANSFVKEKKNG